MPEPIIDPAADDTAFFDLATRYLDGQATEQDVATLTDTLRTSDAHRRLFALLSYQSRLITHVHRAKADPVSSPKPHLSVAKVRMQTPNSNRRLTIYALAAALLLTATAVAIYVFAINPKSDIRNPRSTAPVATLIDATGDVFVNDDFASPGSEYAAGSYSIESGSAQFLLGSNVTVDLRGKTRLRMHNPMSASLESGSASFNCPPGSEGFTVRLPDGSSVVDLGTAFRVWIDKDGRAQVRVAAGKVRWTPPGPGAAPLTLSTGQRASIVGGLPQLLDDSQVASTVLIDFSTVNDIEATNPDDTNGNDWNTIGFGDGNAADTTVTNLLLSDNSGNSPWDITVDHSGTAGVNPRTGFGGTAIDGPVGDAAPFDVTGTDRPTVDGIFTQGNLFATIAIDDLIPNGVYEIALIGGRASGGADGLVTLTVGSAVSGLDGSNQAPLLNDGTILSFTAIANASGQLAYTYQNDGATLNAMSITQRPAAENSPPESSDHSKPDPQPKTSESETADR